jgi:hypothetical protein
MHLRTLATALLFAFTSQLAHAAQWQELFTDDRVVVSKQVMDDSKFFAFKGETTYDDADPDQVLYVLMDNEHRTEWVGRLASSHIIERSSAHDYILYQHFELPAIFSDRDYVYHGVATRDTETGVVILAMESVEHAEAPPTVGVRANLLLSRYILTPLDGGKTKIEVEIQTDPQGAMPAWLVNLIQRSWPVDTLNGIRTQLGKPYTDRYPLPGVEEEAEAEELESLEISEEPGEHDSYGGEEPSVDQGDTGEQGEEAEEGAAGAAATEEAAATDEETADTAPADTAPADTNAEPAPAAED